MLCGPSKGELARRSNAELFKVLGRLFTKLFAGEKTGLIKNRDVPISSSIVRLTPRNRPDRLAPATMRHRPLQPASQHDMTMKAIKKTIALSVLLTMTGAN